MKTIAIRDAMTLLYFKRHKAGVVPELTAWLVSLGLKGTANYMALLVRNLQDRGLVELIGSQPGVRNWANVWALTSEGESEAATLEKLFSAGLTPPAGDPKASPARRSEPRPGRKSRGPRVGRNPSASLSSKARRPSHRMPAKKVSS